MKKTVLLLLAILTMASFAACAQSVPANNTITPVELTDREKLIASVTGDKNFMFEYNVDDSYGWMTLKVDKYEFGEKSERPIAMLSSGMTGEGFLVLSVDEPSDAEKHPIIRVDIGAANEECTASHHMEDVAENIDTTAKSWGANPLSEISVDEKAVLACLRYINRDSMSPLSDEFFSNPDSHLDEIADDDIVYVFSCEFAEKPEEEAA